MSNFRSIFILLCVVSSFNLSGQISIKGNIVDEENKPIIGATISILNLNIGTITDLDGLYEIHDLPLIEVTVFVDYVGYQRISKTIIIEHDLILDFIMSKGSTLLNTIVVSGSKYEKRIEDEVISIEVLGASSLSAQNAISIDDALHKGTSVNIIDGQANIRGGAGFSYGAGSRVLILLDDIPMLQADGGTVNWTDLPIESVEQVEILKGAASALYGSSALNGVINLKTDYATSKKKTKIRIDNEFYLSPKDRRLKWWKTPRHKSNISVMHSQKINKFSFLVSGNYLNRESFNKNTFLKQGRLFTKLKYSHSDNLQFGVSVNYNKADKGNYYYWKDKDSLLVGTQNTINHNKHDRISIDPYIKYSSSKYAHHKLLTRAYFVNNENSGSNSVKSNWLYGEYNYQYVNPSKFYKLIGGVVIHKNDVNAELYQGQKYSQANSALYIQTDLKILKNLNTTFGYRYEYNTIDVPFPKDSIKLQKEGRSVLRAGLNFQPFEFSWIRASYGQGYRFPTIAEKFISTDLGGIPILPNYKLESENGFSVEIGVRQGIKLKGFKGFIDLSYFYNQYQNMMEFRLNRSFPLYFSAQNVGDTKINGFESIVYIENNKSKLKTKLQFGYTYINPQYLDFTERIKIESSSDKNVLKYRNKHVFKLWNSYSYNKMNAIVSMSYHSQMEAIDIVFEGFIPGLKEFREERKEGTFLLNLNLGYKFEKFNLALYSNNILNNLYSDRPGIISPPLSIGTKLSINL